MANTKISALTTDSSPDRNSDYVPTYDASAVTNKKVLLSDLGGYSMRLFIGSTGSSPADSSTYYFHPHAAGALPTTAANVKARILRSGTIRKVYIDGTCTAGSSENSTFSIRLNDTTDTTITSAAAMNATPFAFSNTAMSVSVSAGDYITIKWATPAWVTNPTSVTMWAEIWIA